MQPNQPIQEQARQLVQGAKQAPVASPAQPQQSNLPVPPPQVALQLAKQALQMPPMVLGTLIWRALHQHGQEIGHLGKNSMQFGQPQPPQAQPLTPPQPQGGLQ